MYLAYILIQLLFYIPVIVAPIFLTEILIMRVFLKYYQNHKIEIEKKTYLKKFIYRSITAFTVGHIMAGLSIEFFHKLYFNTIFDKIGELLLVCFIGNLVFLSLVFFSIIKNKENYWLAIIIRVLSSYLFGILSLIHIEALMGV